MMVTAHSKMLESSTSPAENPSTGCFVSSATATVQWRLQLYDPCWLYLALTARACSPLSCFLSRLVA